MVDVLTKARTSPLKTQVCSEKFDLTFVTSSGQVSVEHDHFWSSWCGLVCSHLKFLHVMQLMTDIAVIDQ